MLLFQFYYSYVLLFILIWKKSDKQQLNCNISIRFHIFVLKPHCISDKLCYNVISSSFTFFRFLKRNLCIIVEIFSNVSPIITSVLTFCTVFDCKLFKLTCQSDVDLFLRKCKNEHFFCH